MNKEVLTDELIEFLGEEYLSAKKSKLTFGEYVEKALELRGVKIG